MRPPEDSSPIWGIPLWFRTFPAVGESLPKELSQEKKRIHDIGDYRENLEMMLSSLAALEIDELESAAVPDCVRMLKEVYGESFLLQAEKYSDKSLFRRLREKTTKLLVKTERLRSSGVRSKKIAEVHEMIVSVPSGKLASGGVFGHLLRNLAESFVDNVLREPVLPMRGCVVYCDLAFGIAEHSGVYVGGRTIVHLDGSGRIEAVSPERFLDRLDGFNSAISIYISCAGDFASGDERTARRAESMVGSRRDYNVLTDNCHRFVYGCLSGDFDNTCSSMETLKLATARRLGTNTWRVWEKSDCEFV